MKSSPAIVSFVEGVFVGVGGFHVFSVYIFLFWSWE